MAHLTLEDLEKEITEDEALNEILVMLEGQKFPATSWQKFSIPRVMCHIGAHIYSKTKALIAYLSKNNYNDTAELEALTRFSRSRFRNERQLAVATQGRGVLACDADEGPHTINVGDVVFTDASGNTFRNVAGLSVSYPATLNSGGSLALLFEAEVAGESANIATSQTLTLLTTFAGVTVTNPAAPGTETWITRAGINQESDPALRTRNETTFPLFTQFELIRDAVEGLVLQSVPAITQVGVDDQNPRGAGTFDVYVAGETTTAGSSDVTAAQAALAARVMGSDTVRTYAAPVVALNLTGTVYYDSKHQQTDVQTAVEAQLDAFVATIPLGGFDYSPGPANVVPKNDIESEIKGSLINGAKFVKTVILTTPASDIAVASFGKVVRGTYSLTYVAVS